MIRFFIAVAVVAAGFIFTLNAQPPEAPAEAVIARYELWRESSLDDRRFKHTDIVRLLSRLKTLPAFTVETLGKSVEGRDISLVKVGNGPVPVLMWSQMHGDEPTATAALMDLLNFIKSNDFPEYKKALFERITLWIVPMLNPDGAEQFQRRNALGIDLNRDAARLQCPESQILKAIRDRSKAQWGFNLHDQNRTYAAGNTFNPATVSFLAPAYDEAKNINEVRGNAMKLIGLLSRRLQQEIPGHIGKYDDTFEPRAFGDNIQKWGSSTILIECGGRRGDREKQSIRRLNFTLFITALDAIANKNYEQENFDTYNSLPYNRNGKLYDLVIRNGRVHFGNQSYLLDIGINFEERNEPGNRRYMMRGAIQELGDMSIFHGYEELDATGLDIYPGTAQTFSGKLTRISDEQLKAWLSGGITTLIVKKAPPAGPQPLKLNLSTGAVPAIGITKTANLIIRDGEKIKFVLVNGFLYRPGDAPEAILNSWID